MKTAANLVGENIRRMRKSLKMSQTALGEAVGLTVQAINLIERGKRQARASNLEAIARALSCSPQDLFAGQAESSPTVESLLRALTEMQSELNKLTDTEDDFATSRPYQIWASADEALKRELADLWEGYMQASSKQKLHAFQILAPVRASASDQRREDELLQPKAKQSGPRSKR